MPNSWNLLDTMARNQFNQTIPQRNMLNQQANNFLEGNWDYSQNPMWRAQKQAAEQQYGRAKQDILSQLPSGGNLSSQLANASLDKARYLTGAAGNIAQDQYNKIYGYATQTAPSLAAQNAGAFGGLDLQQELGRMEDDRSRDLGWLQAVTSRDIAMMGDDTTRYLGEMDDETRRYISRLSNQTSARNVNRQLDANEDMFEAEQRAAAAAAARERDLAMGQAIGAAAPAVIGAIK